MEEKKSKSRKNGEETRQRLLETTLNLIWRSSYGSVSVDDICREADVKKGSFYHFFPSKCALTIAAFDESWRLMQPYYDEIFSQQYPPLERFERLCKSQIAKQALKKQEFGHVCGCPFATIGSELCGTDENVRSKSAELMFKTLTYYESTIIEAVGRGDVPACDAKTKASELYGFMTGVMMHARIRNELSALDGLSRGFLNILGVASDVIANVIPPPLPSPSAQPEISAIS